MQDSWMRKKTVASAMIKKLKNEYCFTSENINSQTDRSNMILLVLCFGVEFLCCVYMYVKRFVYFVYTK